ncbi:unnamed protein product [Ilex paraguariensis]|uniref:Uncharacterized protein n=1 Tax=Ilex paraguariensis TaxID=185542 RepID=A0ABC8R149_9AQUA
MKNLQSNHALTSLGKCETKSFKMRYLSLALVLMMLSSCLAINRKALMAEMHGHEQRQLVEDDGGIGFEYSGSGVNNHHEIHRKDFNNYSGGASKGGDDHTSGGET